MADAPFPGQGLRVLVVEDLADASETLAMLLRLERHSVWVAADGPAALRLTDECDPDIVLLDICLPGFDGWEVARQLRSRPLRKRPLLVAVTGYGRDCDRQCSAEAGIDLHLVKPVVPEALVGLLQRFRQTVARPMAGAERRLRSGRRQARAGLREVADAARVRSIVAQAAQVAAYRLALRERARDLHRRVADLVDLSRHHIASSQSVCRRTRDRLDTIPDDFFAGRALCAARNFR